MKKSHTYTHVCAKNKNTSGIKITFKLAQVANRKVISGLR